MLYGKSKNLDICILVYLCSNTLQYPAICVVPGIFATNSDVSTYVKRFLWRLMMIQLQK